MTQLLRYIQLIDEYDIDLYDIINDCIVIFYTNNSFRSYKNTIL